MSASEDLRVLASATELMHHGALRNCGAKAA